MVDQRPAANHRAKMTALDNLLGKPLEFMATTVGFVTSRPLCDMSPIPMLSGWHLAILQSIDEQLTEVSKCFLT